MAVREVQASEAELPWQPGGKASPEEELAWEVGLLKALLLVVLVSWALGS